MEPQNPTINRTERRLSFKRLFFVIVLLLGLSFGTTLSFEKWQETTVVTDYEPWFAAYVDVTSTPIYTFEQRGAIENSDVILSFIVSAHDDACTPTWGGYYTMAEAADALDLDRRIARFQLQGGRIAISFGGLLNSELALLCTDEIALAEAYKSVIERYNINTIDLDLELEGLTNLEAAERRARVIAELQKAYRDEGRDLAVWLTLPVAPQGLTQDGTNAVTVVLESGLDLAGVNVMTMNYGASNAASDTMSEASKKALQETHRQLTVLYKLAGLNLTSTTIWNKLGATPMIGQNDVTQEIFTIADAVALNAFAREKGIGRMSMWSANRDIPCGANYVDVSVVSDLCSGVVSPSFAFANVLGMGFAGDLMQNAKMITTESTSTGEYIVDDPSTSPYQIWHEAGIYLKGTKVVWRGNVYEAKWWTKNESPDNPVLQAWETPWQLIGPVLPGDKPMTKLDIPPYIFPQWYGGAVYDAGDRVMFEGVPFRAKWWNQGESPAASAANPDSSPWIPLTQPQVEEILKARGVL
jgi:chitinase